MQFLSIHPLLRIAALRQVDRVAESRHSDKSASLDRPIKVWGLDSSVQHFALEELPIKSKVHQFEFSKNFGLELT